MYALGRVIGGNTYYPRLPSLGLPSITLIHKLHTFLRLDLPLFAQSRGDLKSDSIAAMNRRRLPSITPILLLPSICPNVLPPITHPSITLYYPERITPNYPPLYYPLLPQPHEGNRG